MPSGRQFVTMLQSFGGDGGTSRVLAGTRGRIYQSTGDGGSWRLLLASGDQSEDTTVPFLRWQCVTLGNIAVFTNAEAYVHWAIYEGEPDVETGMTAIPSDDHIALGVTSVKVLGAWQGFVFYANVVMEGQIYKNRVLWSDFNDPISIRRGGESVAGYSDLDGDEEVLRIEKLGSRSMLYTDKSVYAMSLVGGTQIWHFDRIYSGPLAMRFRNSLINMGNRHVYAASSDLVVMEEFAREPQTFTFLTSAAGAIFKGLDVELLEGLEESGIQAFGPIHQSFCHNLIGGFDQERQIGWISWPSDQDTSGIPAQSIAIQWEHKKACLVDHGFTAFCSHAPKDGYSLRKWLADIGACVPEPIVGEGNPEYGSEPDQDLRWIRNSTEDKDLPVSEDSVCSKLAANPELEPNCDPCVPGWWFLMASALDMTIKRYQPDSDRVRCVDPGTAGAWTIEDHPTSTAQYTTEGCVSLLQLDPLTYGKPADKTAEMATVHGDTPDVANPVDDDPDARPTIHVHVGVGAQVSNMIWHPCLKTRPLDVLSSRTPSQHAARNTRPATPPTFPFFRSGSFVAWRLLIADVDGGPVTGAIASINEMRVRLMGTHRDWNWP